MSLVRLGLANVNTTVGAFDSNTDLAIVAAQEMDKQHCTLGVFPEMTIPGYPTEDFIQWSGFVDGQFAKLLEFAEKTSKLWPIFNLGLVVFHDGLPYNCSVLVYRGRILGIVPKEELPTYNVFYEGRTLTRGVPFRQSKVGEIPFGDFNFEFPFGQVALSVCEDIWSSAGPLARRTYSGAEIVLNLSASPFRAGVAATRREMIATRASDFQALVVYCNLIGGNGALVFDGGGFVNQNGQMLFETKRWTRGLNISCVTVDMSQTRRKRLENSTWRHDQHNFLLEGKTVSTIAIPDYDSDYLASLRIERPTGQVVSMFMPDSITPPNPLDEYFDDLVEACVLGLEDYFNKTGAFDCILIAESGGKDSYLSTLFAYLVAERRFEHLPDEEKKAAIKKFVRCLSMPTKFNSDTTKSIARLVCEEFGLGYFEESIADEFERERLATERLLLPGEKITKIGLQNIQARIRGTRMWNWSNTNRGLWVQTGNMSEKAVGYTTVGGDLMGAFSLLGNMPKTVVIGLLHHLYTRYPVPSLMRLLETEASAELDANQSDEKDLMPFPILDTCMSLFFGQKLMPIPLYRKMQQLFSDDQLKAMWPAYKPGTLKSWVKKAFVLFSHSIFKWVQSPESVHLGTLDLDRERATQLPVVHSMEWLRLGELDKLED